MRAGYVDLVPPLDLPEDTAPLRMLAVRVLEKTPPEGKEPLDWLLLTTEGDPTKQNALRIAEWYEKRWLIEEYFSALKTGTRIKDRKLNAADDLRRCLAFDAITACTVMSVERLARSAPDTPAKTVVHDDEIHVLAVHMAKPNHRKQRARRTLTRRSRSSRSTPRASPDSSRRSASPCRAHESYGKDT